MLCGVLLGAFLVGAGCGGSAEGLSVYGAASLRDVLAAEVAADPAHAVRISTGGSNLLVEQLLAGADADVVITASGDELERLVDAGLVAPDDVRSLFTNQLVVIVRRERSALSGGGGALAEPLGDEGDPDGPSGDEGEAPLGGVGSLARFLAPDGGRIAIAHPTAVPAGRYARAWLEQRGDWEALAPRVLQALDVRAALAAVESGGAAFGVVYATDARTSDAVRVVHVVADGPRVEYFGGVLSASDRLDAARAFLAGLDALGSDRAASAETRARLVAAGFGVEAQTGGPR